MKKVLRINRSSDEHFWYTKHVNSHVPYIGEEDDIFWSREADGYKNIVKKTDADIVNIHPEDNLYCTANN